MQPFTYQQCVFDALSKHQPVILQAPTGAGKTQASLYPFLYSCAHPEVVELPGQCIYSVPLRTLANQFVHEYLSTVQNYRQKYKLKTLGRVSLQTGERPDDPRFESDLLFTTVDQTLSSFLSIPYALSTSLANFNTGAVLGSYHVFDEFHLFPMNKDGSGAFSTTLHMLQILGKLTPWTLMTATFSRTLLSGLCEQLKAVEVSPATTSFDDIPSQKGKERYFSVRENPLSASDVWDDMQENNRQRVLAICNTVDRAIELATELRHIASPNVRVMLLHSRFFQQDRTKIEELLAKEFGEDKRSRTPDPIILVATQVVEVGLNITCEALHTEIAPASSVIQRAGRCARFVRERGQVFIYEVPKNDKGEPQYAPYKGQEDVCEHSWQEFLNHNNQKLDYSGELEIVDIAHHEFDKHLLETIKLQKPEQRKKIKDAWTSCDRNLGPDLIREIDNITVILHPNPSQENIPNPYSLQGISIRRSTLMSKWRLLEELGADLDWIIAILQETKSSLDDAVLQTMGQRPQVLYDWQLRLRQGSDSKALLGVDFIVLNPAVARYDAELGLRFAMGDASFSSPLTVKNEKDPPAVAVYRYETYEQHIEKMFFVHRRDFLHQSEYVETRLEKRLGLEQGVLDRALRLIFAIHDVGKLDERWQTWAHTWQQAVHKLNPHAVVPLPDVTIAHTDYNGKDPAQRDLQKRVTERVGKRPNHAAESVLACLNLIREVAGNSESLYSAMITAVVRHHNALTSGNVGSFVGYGTSNSSRAAENGVNAALRAVHLQQLSSANIRWQFPAESISNALVNPHESIEATLLYFYLVRLLRRTDQQAVQE
ncbi:MAG TPA: CRISPR-associated helicase Cas3' [Ktedonobacteraceae bacterium]|nr:CRISPR-associated helicase Cas3' [Ktedonobacteraceae bacterium]